MRFATTAAEVTALTDEAIGAADELLAGIVAATTPTWATMPAARIERISSRS